MIGAKVEHGPTDTVALGEEKASDLAKFIARVGPGVVIVFLLVRPLSDGSVIRRRNPTSQARTPALKSSIVVLSPRLTEYLRC